MVTHFVKRLIKTEKSIALSMRAILSSELLCSSRQVYQPCDYIFFIKYNSVSWYTLAENKRWAIIMSSRHFLHFGHSLSSVISSGQEGSSTSVVMTIVKSFLEHLFWKILPEKYSWIKRQVDECPLIHVYQEQ